MLRSKVKFRSQAVLWSTSLRPARHGGARPGESLHLPVGVPAETLVQSRSSRHPRHGPEKVGGMVPPPRSPASAGSAPRGLQHLRKPQAGRMFVMQMQSKTAPNSLGGKKKKLRQEAKITTEQSSTHSRSPLGMCSTGQPPRFKWRRKGGGAHRWLIEPRPWRLNLPGNSRGRGRPIRQVGTQGRELFLARRDSGCGTTWAGPTLGGKRLPPAGVAWRRLFRAEPRVPALWLVIFWRAHLRGSLAPGQLGYAVWELRLFCITFPKSPSSHSSAQGSTISSKSSSGF